MKMISLEIILYICGEIKWIVMETLRRQYVQLLKFISTKHIRQIYNSINWDARLIGIKGERGVGKTTLMLQRIIMAYPNRDEALYASLDDIWFGGHTLVELAREAAATGIKALFLDEVHRMPGWEQQIKNIYDFLPQLRVVFTGSSLLEIDRSVADLSRRCLMYSLPGLSFREYLEFEGETLPMLTLPDILYNHVDVCRQIGVDRSIMKKFHSYLKCGYYPFYKSDNEADYLTRVSNMISAVIDYDIPTVESVEYATLLKLKQLLLVMASQTPSPMNVTTTARMLGVSKNHLIKLLGLLDRAQILRLLYYKAERDPKSMSKPQKVLIGNTSLSYALGYADKGKVRESFLASMCSPGHELSYPKAGDLLIDGRYLIEVGGSGKKFNQIKDLPDSFVAADDVWWGIDHRLPLWLFGLLY